MDMINPLQMRVFHQRHLIKPRHALAHIFESGLERTKALHIGGGAHVLVVIKDHQPVLIAHRDDRGAKSGLIPRHFGAALGFDPQRIGFITAKAVFGGDEIGADTLRHKISLHCEAWVDGNCRPIAAHWHAAHHFNTSGDIAVSSPTTNLIGSQINRL